MWPAVCVVSRVIEHLGQWWEWLTAPERAAQSLSWCGVIVVAGIACWMAVAAGDRRRERRSRSLAQRRAAVRWRRRTTRRIRLGPLRTGVAMCTCCWSLIAVGEQPAVAHCASCGGLQHADCARWIGGCGRYGCGSRAVEPRAAERITSPPRAAP